MADRFVTRKKLEQACFGSRTMAKIAAYRVGDRLLVVEQTADRVPAGGDRARPDPDVDRCVPPPAKGKSALPGYRDEAFAAPFQGSVGSQSKLCKRYPLGEAL
jgi:hypothetical protein